MKGGEEKENNQLRCKLTRRHTNAECFDFKQNMAIEENVKLYIRTHACNIFSTILVSVGCFRCLSSYCITTSSHTHTKMTTKSQ